MEGRVGNEGRNMEHGRKQVIWKRDSRIGFITAAIGRACVMRQTRRMMEREHEAAGDLQRYFSFRQARSVHRFSRTLSID